jgi:hypothetical protein
MVGSNIIGRIVIGMCDWLFLWGRPWREIGITGKRCGYGRSNWNRFMMCFATTVWLRESGGMLGEVVEQGLKVNATSYDVTCGCIGSNAGISLGNVVFLLFGALIGGSAQCGFIGWRVYRSGDFVSGSSSGFTRYTVQRLGMLS